MVRLATEPDLGQGAHPAPRRADPFATARPRRISAPHGFDVVLANPPFSGRLEKQGRPHAVPAIHARRRAGAARRGAGTGAHRELRRRLIENNTIGRCCPCPAACSIPIRRQAVLVFRKGGATERVMFACRKRRLQARRQPRPADHRRPGLRRVTGLASGATATRTRTGRRTGGSPPAISGRRLQCANRHRPQNRSKVEHRDPLEIGVAGDRDGNTSMN